MNDPTEDARRQLAPQINANARSREALEERYGKVWNTTELSQEFEVLGFASPFVAVTRRSDGAKGSLEFQQQPRLYFNFVED